MIWTTLSLTGIVLFVFLSDCYRFKITPNPTSRKVKKTVFEICPKEVKGPIYELGSGFGFMAVALSKRYPDQKVYSYEKATWPYLFQKLALKMKRKSEVKLLYQDFLKEDLSKAELIYCYLYRGAMPKLLKKIENEIETQTTVITHTFAFDGVEPKKKLISKDLYQTPVYLYEFSPATKKC